MCVFCIYQKSGNRIEIYFAPLFIFFVHPPLCFNPYFTTCIEWLIHICQTTQLPNIALEFNVIGRFKLLDISNSTLAVERWAGWGRFHDHNFTLKYHIHNSSALWFDMQPYWKFYQLRKKKGGGD